MNGFPSEVYTRIPLCICTISLLLPGEEPLGCLHFLAVMNRAAVNMAKQVSVEQDSKSFGHMPESSVVNRIHV